MHPDGWRIDGAAKLGRIVKICTGEPIDRFYRVAMVENCQRNPGDAGHLYAVTSPSTPI